MGQPIVVVEKPSVANPGMVRFETNRALTGMGHERYRAGTEVRGERPPDELARRLLARGGIEAVHVNGSVVTVDLAKGHDAAGLREVIESLYIHYPATEDDAEAPAEADVPTSEGELVEEEAAAATDAPDPDRAPATPAAEVAAEELAGAAEEKATPPAAPAADATAQADEVTDADVQQVEGDAPTLTQSPVGDDPGAAPADDAGDPGTTTDVGTSGEPEAAADEGAATT